MAVLIPTGCGSLDKALEGGLWADSTVLLYGEAETGKTTLAMQCAVNSARMGYKTLYVDSDGTFSPERLYQIAFPDFEEVSDSIILARPTTFNEQAEIVDNLEKYVSRKFGFIVFDTVTSLYRSEILGKKETFDLNRKLNRQVAALVQIAKSFGISVLLVSQVRSVLGEADITPVATRVLRFWCNTVLRMSRMGRREVKVSVEKSGGQKKKMSSLLVIEECGFIDHAQ